MSLPPTTHNHPDDGVLRDRSQGCGTCDALRPRDPYVIYKYPVGLGRTDIPDVNIAAEVVHFGHQGGEFMVWVQINKSGFNEHHKGVLTVKVFATGEDFDAGPKTDSLRHVGSLQSGPFVWHCYQQKGAW